MNRHSPIGHLALASLLAVVCNLPAAAQPPKENQVPDSLSISVLPGARRPGADPLQLLLVEEVQQELELTDTQTEALEAIAHEAYSSLAQTSRGIQEEQALEDHIDEFSEQVAQTLNEEQLERFRGIVLQLNGLSAEPTAPQTRGTTRLDPLELTPEQQQRLDTLSEVTEQTLRQGFVSTRSSDPDAICTTVEANREKLESIRAARATAAEEVLTDEQQATLEQIKGEPFELDPPPCEP